jgi:subtilisin family serine protease
MLLLRLISRRRRPAVATTAAATAIRALVAFALFGCAENQRLPIQPPGEFQTIAAVRTAVERGLEGVAGEYIVLLKSTSNGKGINLFSNHTPSTLATELAARHGFSVTRVFTRTIEGFSARLDERAIESLRHDPAVQTIEQEQYFHATGQTTPSGVARTGAVRVSTNTPASVDVYVLDTGIQPNHPDLNVVESKSFVPSAKSAADDNGHGTHVAGIIGARDNGQFVVGVCPGVRLHAIKVLNSSGNGQTSWIIAGLDYVVAQKQASPRNAVVVNLSLSGYAGSAEYSVLDSAIVSAIDAGVTVTIAAGNASDDAAMYTPAHVREAITVGAFDDGAADGKTDSWASFSNYGSVVDVLAPGVNILSTSTNSKTATLSGTSMAAPHVAGVAALYLSQHPGALPDEVAARIFAAANVPLPGPNRRVTGVPSNTTALCVYAGNFRTTPGTTARYARLNEAQY